VANNRNLNDGWRWLVCRVKKKGKNTQEGRAQHSLGTHKIGRIKKWGKPILRGNEKGAVEGTMTSLNAKKNRHFPKIHLRGENSAVARKYGSQLREVEKKANGGNNKSQNLQIR